MLDASFEFADDFALFCFLAVEFQTEAGETGGVETPFDDFECGHFFGDEENGLSGDEHLCDHVGDGL